MPKEIASAVRDFQRRAGLTRPRILTKRQAAEYCGLSLSGYQAWVDQGFVPGPLPGTKRFDRLAIDRAIDELSGIGRSGESDSEYDNWKAKR